MLFPFESQKILLSVVYSNRKDGTMNSKETNGKRNLKKFQIENNFDPSLSSQMLQTHSKRICKISPGVVKKCDGLVIENAEISGIVRTADCLPIVLFNPKTKMLCILHAGYKGLEKEILQNGIFKMKGETCDIYAFLGPSICVNCYEVDGGRYKRFERKFNFPVGIKKNNKYFLDLRKIATQILLNNGISSSCVQQLDYCTHEDDRFFSYRGGDINSRFVTMAKYEHV